MKDILIDDCPDLKMVLHTHRPYPPAGFRLPFIVAGSIALMVLDIILCAKYYHAPWWMNLLVGLTTSYWLMTLGDARRIYLAWKENNFIGYMACIEMKNFRDPDALRARFYPADQHGPPENMTKAPRLLLALGGWGSHSRIEHSGSPFATFPWKILAFSFTGYEEHWVLLQDERGNRLRLSLSDAFRAIMEKNGQPSIHFHDLLFQKTLAHPILDISATRGQDRPN